MMRLSERSSEYSKKISAGILKISVRQQCPDFLTAPAPWDLRAEQGTYKYLTTAYGKAILIARLAVRNLVLIPALA